MVARASGRCLSFSCPSWPRAKLDHELGRRDAFTPHLHVSFGSLECRDRDSAQADVWIL